MSRNRYSMYQRSLPSPARTQPEPRKPSKVVARSVPACIHEVASTARAGSMRRSIATVIG